LPLFLLWVNLIWTVILGGAVFVHAINAHQIGLRDRNYPDLLASLLILWRCYRASAVGEAVSERELLHQGLAAEQWERISAALLDHRVLSLNYQGDYLLSQNLKLLSLQQLANILSLPRQLPQGQKYLQTLPWGSTALQYLAEVDASQEAVFAVDVASLFEQSAPAAVAPAVASAAGK
jgi:membrane protein